MASGANSRRRPPQKRCDMDDNNDLVTPPMRLDAPVDAPPAQTSSAADDLAPDDGGEAGDGTETLGEPGVQGPRKRRRGSRGGKNRRKPSAAGAASDDEPDDGDNDDSDNDDGDADEIAGDTARPVAAAGDGEPRPARAKTPGRPARMRSPEGGPAKAAYPDEMPDRMSENRPTAEAADRALVRKPQIGDTRPAPPPPPSPQRPAASSDADAAAKGGAKKKRRRGGQGKKPNETAPLRAPRQSAAAELDADVFEKRRGRERNGRPVGRYLMAVQVRPTLTQVAVLEGRTLIEHYVSRPADDISQIHGNIYLGRVQNVLPGMEAAFVDIGTPKNAVLYRGDVQYDSEDIVEKANQPRIEHILKPRQLMICQVTKNPIGAKGARLTQEVSLPGRFVVLIPNSKTYGISKRLPDDVRKRLRNILDRVKPAEHGLIVRTAAENATEHELSADMTRLLDQWTTIEAKAKKANSATLLYREPELAVRVIREEFNAEYRGVIIDDQRLFDDVKDYVTAFNPELADRIEHHDAVADGLPLFERLHIHEQLHKALDRKVWLPSGGSLIIEHTEALTVIDVNTGKNVGTTNLEQTVFANNLEAAEEVAKQLRLRDIGGIVVIDFIDMEIKENRRKVVDAFRAALARDKTRTQVFDISELGLVEMTRKRIGEGLLVNFADQCPNCEGRGVVIDHAMLE
jgi:ribonuclease E